MDCVGPFGPFGPKTNVFFCENLFFGEMFVVVVKTSQLVKICFFGENM